MAMTPTKVPPADIRDFLSYDPTTGEFRWLKRPPYANSVKAGAVAGNARSEGYRAIMFRGRHYLAHRLAWLFVYGVWPPGDLDHKDRDKANNRIDNLRLATQGQNKANSGPYRTNTSGFKGVSFNKQRGRWEAQIQLGGRNKNIGYFNSPEAAARAYDAAAREHFDEFAGLNFKES